MSPKKLAAVPPGPRTKARSSWCVPAGLIVLSLIPVAAGGARLAELTGGADVTPGNERFFLSPIPVVAHIAGAIAYSILGAFQFLPSLRQPRRGKPNWHRLSGRILIPAGLLVALSGLWMAVFYQLPPSDGFLLLVFRLIFGTAMLAGIVLGILALRRRDFTAHGAWMTRAYAIGVAAGTQSLILIVPELFSSPPDVTARALLMASAWIINLAIAEYAIRRRSQTPASAGHQNLAAAPGAGTAR